MVSRSGKKKPQRKKELHELTPEELIVYKNNKASVIQNEFRTYIKVKKWKNAEDQVKKMAEKKQK